MELHQNDLLTPHIIHISVISVSVDKNLFLLHMYENTEKTVNSSLTREIEGADNPDTAKLWRIQSLGKLCPKMYNKNVEIGEEFSAAADYRARITINWQIYTRQRSTRGYGTLSPAQHLQYYHGDSLSRDGYSSTGAVQMVWTNTGKHPSRSSGESRNVSC